MSAVQLALDLEQFGPKRQEREQRYAAFLAAHEAGQVPLPWNSSCGLKKGSPVDAYRCCACGGVELALYSLRINHGCDPQHWDGQSCHTDRVPMCTLVPPRERDR